MLKQLDNFTSSGHFLLEPVKTSKSSNIFCTDYPYIPQYTTDTAFTCLKGQSSSMQIRSNIRKMYPKLLSCELITFFVCVFLSFIAHIVKAVWLRRTDQLALVLRTVLYFASWNKRRSIKVSTNHLNRVKKAQTVLVHVQKKIIPEKKQKS